MWCQTLVYRLRLLGLLGPPAAIAKQIGSRSSNPDYARHDDEIRQHAAPVQFLRDFGVALPPPPRTDVLVHGIVRPFVFPVIKMRDVVSRVRMPRSKPLSEAAVRAGAGALLRRRTLVLVVGVLCPLRAVPAIATGLVEGRGRPAEGAAFLVQTGGWTRAKV